VAGFGCSVSAIERLVPEPEDEEELDEEDELLEEDEELDELLEEDEELDELLEEDVEALSSPFASLSLAAFPESSGVIFMPFASFIVISLSFTTDNDLFVDRTSPANALEVVSS
jgi:uncharacterized membrane protein